MILVDKREVFRRKFIDAEFHALESLLHLALSLLAQSCLEGILGLILGKRQVRKGFDPSFGFLPILSQHVEGDAMKIEVRVLYE